MRSACPISNDTVDERAARVSALCGLVLIGFSLALASPWPVLFLAADFGLRGFGARSLSPVAKLSRWTCKRLGIAASPVNAGPKAFAAKLGFAFSLTMATAFLAGRGSMALVAGVPFALCALLESAVGFCVGCWAYQAWQRLTTRAEPAQLRR
jgi:hypothetical protein